jgi:hypothetical protein
VFKLTKEHMEALDAAARKEADRNLAAYARRRFPDRLGKVPDAEVHGFVRNARAHAKVHGFEHEHDIAVLLDLGVMYGAGFDQRGWTGEVLAKQDLPAAERAGLLRLQIIKVQTKSADAPKDGPAPQAMPKPVAAPSPVFAGAAPAPAEMPARSPFPPGPPQTGGQLPTIEDALKIRDAAVEKVAKLPPNQRNRVAAICAAINTATGQIAVGFKIHGESFGKSAEDLAVEHIGGNAPTVKLTTPVSPRTKAALLVSKRSRKIYAAEQFTDGTAFEE